MVELPARVDSSAGLLLMCFRNARTSRLDPGLLTRRTRALGDPDQDGTRGQSPKAAFSSCRPIAAASGMGTAFPICRAIAVFEPTQR